MKCIRRGCQQEGIECPVLMVWAASHTGDPLEIVFGLPTCLVCQAEVTVRDFLHPPIMRKVERLLKTHRKMKPDWSSARVRWVRMDGPMTLH